MLILQTPIQGAMIIQPNVFNDPRGFFTETFNKKSYKKVTSREFVQDNLSFSKKNVLRGLHIQFPNPQDKLIYVLHGSIRDVIVDLRPSSNTFKQTYQVNLSAENGKQFYVPRNCAHGFAVLSDTALVAYKCTSLYESEGQYTLKWDDTDLAIDWGISNPVVSDKDNEGLTLDELVSIMG